ncbi:unknown [Feldmannia species virus]|uniref:Uncharacterized protein n=1 Tax=Feldmannia species virus TaxID=39420 RepID=B5LWH2_9PHYC|nr:hypothetical protein FeldSpV_gp083 [Feldmannia species virus]ACH46835.1 unknown [Feldmannia species virus]
MNSTSDLQLYTDWITKWRAWNHAWCESTEPMVQFEISFISRRRLYEASDHAELATNVGDYFKSLRVDKGGVFEITTGSAARKAIEVKKIDSQGIVTLQLSLFSRAEALVLGLILERSGHSLLHENGRVFADTGPRSNDGVKRMLPFRDDPVWGEANKRLTDT